MHSLGCSSTHLLLKLLLIYGSVFVSSSLRLPPSSLEAIIWGNISPLSPPMQRSAVKTEAHNRLIIGSYIVPGATLLGEVLVWYTVSRLLQQTLLRKPLLFYGFVFVFFSFLSLLLSHGLPPRVYLECTLSYSRRACRRQLNNG